MTDEEQEVLKIFHESGITVTGLKKAIRMMEEFYGWNDKEEE